MRRLDFACWIQRARCGSGEEQEVRNTGSHQRKSSREGKGITMIQLCLAQALGRGSLEQLYCVKKDIVLILLSSSLRNHKFCFLICPRIAESHSSFLGGL